MGGVIMKQTIEIEVPDGKKAVWRGDKIVFVDINPQLPRTWEDFCNKYTIKPSEVYIGSNSEIKGWIPSKYRDKDINKNLLPDDESARRHITLMQLHQLRDCYRQGWKPDWDDETYKYCIERYPKSRNGQQKEWNIITYKKISKFLSFQSEYITRAFLDNFKDLIEQAGDLI